MYNFHRSHCNCFFSSTNQLCYYYKNSISYFLRKLELVYFQQYYQQKIFIYVPSILFSLWVKNPVFVDFEGGYHDGQLLFCDLIQKPFNVVVLVRGLYWRWGDCVGLDEHWVDVPDRFKGELEVWFLLHIDIIISQSSQISNRS